MRVLYWLALSVAFGGCAGRDTHSETPESATRRALGGAANRANQKAAESRALPSRELVVVPGGTFGPYIGRSSSSGVLVWASRDAGKAEWHSLGVKLPEGTASSPVTLGPAPEQLSLVVVREARPQGGFVVLSAEPHGESSVVHAMLLGSQGQLESGPFELAQTQGTLL